MKQNVAPHSRAGASHSLCAASASGPATPSLHGTSAVGRYAPFGVCLKRGATLARPPGRADARIRDAAALGTTVDAGRDKPVPNGCFSLRRRPGSGAVP